MQARACRLGRDHTVARAFPPISAQQKDKAHLPQIGVPAGRARENVTFGPRVHSRVTA